MKLKRRSLAAPVPEVGARPSTPPEHDEPAHFQSTPGSVVMCSTSAGDPSICWSIRSEPSGHLRDRRARRRARVGRSASSATPSSASRRASARAATPRSCPRQRSITGSGRGWRRRSRRKTPVDPGPGVNRKVVSVNELAEHGRARGRVVSGVASNDDDGEQHRVINEDTTRVTCRCNATM